ncbi:MAG: hypothetical protein CMK00_06705 [Planctomycetes bacterium]|jgi:hypothetical protein|nr:hypothetical protein [Planctomycetota bacterium]HJO25998.1 hypothetical protein [Planctomycetota bacterium]
MEQTLRPALGFHLLLILLPGLISLGACGEAPQHVSPQESGQPATHQPASPHGADGIGGPASVALAAPHGGSGEEPGEPLYGGTVRLEGELATAQTGGVFIIGRQVGSGLLTLVRKYEISEAALSADGSARLLSFTLDNTHGMGGASAALDQELTLVVRYDPDGLVESKEGQVEASLVAATGSLDLELTLSAGG